MAVDRDRFKRRSEEGKPYKKASLQSDIDPVVPEDVARNIEPEVELKNKPRSKKRSRSFSLKPNKRHKLAVGIFICIVILVVVLVSFFAFTGKKPKPVAHKPKVQTYTYNPVEAGGTVIPFKPAVPSAEPQLANLVGTNYNAPDRSYTFSDLYLGVPIQVSEQELPGKFPSTAAALQTVSKALPATTSFSSPYGEIYMNNAASPAKQTLVASRYGLLIFIQSSYVLQNSAWTSYIGSLEEVE